MNPCECVIPQSYANMDECLNDNLVPRPIPLSFCSSVCIDGCGRAVHFSPLFQIHVLLSMQTEEQKERGRPGNEATLMTLRLQLETKISDRCPSIDVTKAQRNDDLIINLLD